MSVQMLEKFTDGEISGRTVRGIPGKCPEELSSRKLLWGETVVGCYRQTARDRQKKETDICKTSKNTNQSKYKTPTIFRPTTKGRHYYYEHHEYCRIITNTYERNTSTHNINVTVFCEAYFFICYYVKICHYRPNVSHLAR